MTSRRHFGRCRLHHRRSFQSSYLGTIGSALFTSTVRMTSRDEESVDYRQLRFAIYYYLFFLPMKVCEQLTFQ